MSLMWVYFYIMGNTKIKYFNRFCGGQGKGKDKARDDIGYT